MLCWPIVLAVALRLGFTSGCFYFEESSAIACVKFSIPEKLSTVNWAWFLRWIYETPDREVNVRASLVISRLQYCVDVLPGAQNFVFLLRANCKFYMAVTARLVLNARRLRNFSPLSPETELVTD